MAKWPGSIVQAGVPRPGRSGQNSRSSSARAVPATNSNEAAANSALAIILIFVLHQIRHDHGPVRRRGEACLGGIGEFDSLGVEALQQRDEHGTAGVEHL